MTKYIIEDKRLSLHVEDSGMSEYFVSDLAEDSCLSVTVSSWDETKQHKEFRPLFDAFNSGGWVKITIETIEASHEYN
jgi:hypothetical protein